jgi:hypothetical protein
MSTMVRFVHLGLSALRVTRATAEEDPNMRSLTSAWALFVLALGIIVSGCVVSIVPMKAVYLLTSSTIA